MNPLQFDALEPKRFEDLVRQLLYDFRDWRQLEATGRSGSDDGFDARGWETVGAIGSVTDSSDDEEVMTEPDGTDQIWLIQCKREKAIGPTKLIGYLNEIPEAERHRLYGVIVAAPADFSKKTRDAFREWCAETGIAECHLWGKAELEDQLFQPKNDHLLFAYFGLSLTIRRRSQQARLRSRTTIKRKLKRILEKSMNGIIIRDADDDTYPYREGRADFPWWVFRDVELTFRGLEVGLHRYHAFIDDDREHWDAAEDQTERKVSRYIDPWRGEDREIRAGADAAAAETEQSLFNFWFALPEANKAWVHVNAIIELDDVLEVDEIGDDITEYPHIYIRAAPGPARPGKWQYGRVKGIERFNPPDIEPRASLRVRKFPDKYRLPEDMGRDTGAT